MTKPKPKPNPINPYDCTACRSVRQEAIRSHRRMQDQHGVLLKVQKSRDEWRDRALKAERRIVNGLAVIHNEDVTLATLEWSGALQDLLDVIVEAMADDEGGE